MKSVVRVRTCGQLGSQYFIGSDTDVQVGITYTLLAQRRTWVAPLWLAGRYCQPFLEVICKTFQEFFHRHRLPIIAILGPAALAVTGHANLVMKADRLLFDY